MNAYRYGLGIVLVAGTALALSIGSSFTSAQAPAAAVDLNASIGKSIMTQVVTLKVEKSKGEPRLVAGRVKFDRSVEACWLAVMGADIKYAQSTEKPFNRALFAVDPMPKVINGKEVEVSGKLGVRDGSGDFDDEYEGTITVAVTAILSKP